MAVVGVCFSPEITKADPLSHVGKKRPVYDRLLDLCLEKGWRTFVFTKKTYLGDRVFDGAWEYTSKKLVWTNEKTTADLVYDRTGGVNFPLQGDTLKVVNIRDFKIFCWDKWAAYQELSDFMPQTYWIEDMRQLTETVQKIATDWVVVKPFNGLQGKGIYIGSKGGEKDFKFDPKYKKYIVQEFVDTSGGVPKIVSGMHDIRVVVINKKLVWGHVRVPQAGKFTSNAAGGGILTELNLNVLPNSIMQVVKKVSEDFFVKYDNPIFSLDFGIDKDDKPYMFEINDQIGFPRWEMEKRDNFLNELVINFESKLE